MSTQIQWRRGTTAQHSVFTGALGEVTVDTDNDTLVVHDGSTVGGFPLARESQVAALSVNVYTKEESNTSLALKVDKLIGKQLSTEDYTTTDKTKLDGIATNANNYVKPVNEPISYIAGLQIALDAKATTTALNTEKGRIDAILLAADANADTFAEVITLVNSIDTTNDQAFAGYVLSNDARSATIEGNVTNLTSSKADKATTYTKSETDAKIVELAPATDISGKADKATTLAGYSISDAYTKTEINSSLALKVDKVAGKGLSAEDYTSIEKSKLDGVAANANNYTLPTATSTVKGGIEIYSDTVQTVASNAVSTTASRTYGVQLNSTGQAVVNVPWVDANTVYTHPTNDGSLHVPATSTTNNGKVLMAGATAGSFSWQTIPSGVTDHTLLTNIGTNTHAQIDTALTILVNTSGTNTGDNAVNTNYASDYRAANFIAGTNYQEPIGTITGIAKGNGANSITSATVRVDYAEPTTALATGILKNTTTTGVHSIAVAGTDYLLPNGSAANLTSFPTLNQNTTGNSATATTLQTARTINGVSFDGSANITISDATAVNLTTAQTIAGIKTFSSNIVGNVTGNLSGNATSATKLTTTRTIALTGDVTGNINFDGSENVSIATTIAANSVALGTDTTGNYVAGVAQGTGISVAGTAGEGWSPTISLTNTGTSGTYRSVTTDAQGRVTSGTNPTTVTGYGITDAYTKVEVDNSLAAKQDVFVSGTNIKTINGNSVLGSGNISTVDTTKLPLTGGTMTGAITAIRETKVAMTDNNIDLSTGNLFTKTITVATTLTISNALAAGNVNSFVLELTNGGSAVITWFSGVKWAGGTAPTLTASGKDILGFYSHDGGTTWNILGVNKDVK